MWGWWVGGRGIRWWSWGRAVTPLPWFAQLFIKVVAHLESVSAVFSVTGADQNHRGYLPPRALIKELALAVSNL